MKPQPRIMTCCYCGTRAMLALDTERHELVCSSCAAPLHNMKALPKTKAERPDWGTHTGIPKAKRGKPVKPDLKKRRKKRKSLFANIVSEVWDEIEDLID